MTVQYRVIDRSLLLPHYKRWLVEPLVRLVPARVTPNAITYAGHLASLAATALVLSCGDRGPGFFAAIALVQLYCWADNADGAHARRTGQSSEWGEVLDHGLDQITSLYVGLMVPHVLGADPVTSMIVAIASSAAAAHTYWEQTRTGTMCLGLLNQVEAMLVLSIALAARGALGASMWDFALFGISMRNAMLAWVLGSVAVGMLRGVLRVRAARGWGTAATALLPIAASATIAAAGACSAMPLIAALGLGAAVTVHWGIHMLAVRFGRDDRSSSWLFGLTAVLFATVTSVSAIGAVLPEQASLAIALVMSAFFAIATIADVAIVRAQLTGVRTQGAGV